MYTGATSNSPFAAVLKTTMSGSPPDSAAVLFGGVTPGHGRQGNGHHAVAISSGAIAAKRTGPHRNGPARRMPYASIRSAALKSCNPSSVTWNSAS